MGKPHLFHLCTLRHVRSFQKRHVLMFFCLIFLFRLPVHALADKKIRTCRMLYNAFRRSGIRTVSDLQSLSGFSHDHIRRIDFPIQLQCLTFLQLVPVASLNSERFRLIQLELACTVNRKTVSIADNIMIDPKGFYSQPIKTQGLFIFFKFNTSDFKRKLRCNHTERIHRPGKPFGTDYRQGFCPFCISHC